MALGGDLKQGRLRRVRRRVETRWWRFFPFALMLLFGPPKGGAQGADRSVLSNPVPLSMCDEVPCVEVTLHQRQLRFALDTGNRQSLIDRSVASDLISSGLAKIDKAATEKSPFTSVALGEIRVGGTEVNDGTFLEFGLHEMAESGRAPHIDGTIGYGILEGHVVHLDLGAHLWSLQTSSGSSCVGNRVSLVPFGSHGPPVLVSSLLTLSGHVERLQLDTFFTGSVLLYSEAVQALGLGERKHQEKDFYPFTDGGVHLVHGPAEQARLNDRARTHIVVQLSLAAPADHNPEGLFDGTAGVKLMMDVPLDIDLRAACVNTERARGER